MGYKQNKQQFNLVGNLKGYIFKDGYKLKYLRLEVDNIEYWIKVRKEHQEQLKYLTQEGVEIKVTGEYELCHKTGKMKLKADDIETFNSNLTINTAPKQKVKQASILICEKSSCWRRGGASLYAELKENLAENGLNEQVKVKTTGCLKKCKHGPNLVFMPDRAHYSRVTTEEVKELLEEHIYTALRAPQ